MQLDEQSYTYQQIKSRTDEAALACREAEGEVLVSGKTFLQQALLFFALQKNNCRPILCHHGLQEGEIHAVVTENQLTGYLAWKTFPCLKKRQRPERAAGKPLAGEAVFGVLSSGSTGTPKVMYRTYESWAGFFPVQNRIFAVDKETKVFIQGNLSFTGNLNVLLAVLFAGGTVCTSDLVACQKWEKIIVGAGVQVIYLVPPKLRLLALRLKAVNDEVRMIFTGSQLLDAKLLTGLNRKFPQAKVLLYYGASELNYITYRQCTAENFTPQNVGRPFPGIDVQVKDGLIYVNSPYHVEGLKMPATLQDTGIFNADGDLLFTGRNSVFINRGGYKINGCSLESKIKGLKGIADVRIMKIEDSRRGDGYVLFVVCKRKYRKKTAKKYLRHSLRHYLRPEEQPNKVVFLPEIPLNDRGKPDQRKMFTIFQETAKIDRR